jgi:hypothetical protein
MGPGDYHDAPESKILHCIVYDCCWAEVEVDAQQIPEGHGARVSLGIPFMRAQFISGFPWLPQLLWTLVIPANMVCYNVKVKHCIPHMLCKLGTTQSDCFEISEICIKACIFILIKSHLLCLP